MLPGLVTLVELLLSRTLVRLSRCAAMRDDNSIDHSPLLTFHDYINKIKVTKEVAIVSDNITKRSTLTNLFLF